MSSVLLAGFVLACGGLACGGCGSTISPPGWDEPIGGPPRGYGAWMEVEVREADAIVKLAGELVAAAEDTLYLGVDGRLLALAAGGVESIRLQKHAVNHGDAAAWSGLGVASTPSHGVYFIVAFPIMAIVSVAGSHEVADASRLVPSVYRPSELAPHARFPQGLPAGVDRSQLARRPWMAPSR